MRKIVPERLVIIFALVLFIFGLSQINAQTFLKNGKIPKDLIITLESQYNGVTMSGNNHYKMTIRADGTVSIKDFTGGRVNKINSKTKKNKLSAAQLEDLVKEFETIDFFNLDSTFLYSFNNCGIPVSHYSKDIISISINGKTKQVSSLEGCLAQEGSQLEKFNKLREKISQIKGFINIKIEK